MWVVHWDGGFFGAKSGPLQDLYLGGSRRDVCRLDQRVCSGAKVSAERDKGREWGPRTRGECQDKGHEEGDKESGQITGDNEEKQ